MTEMNDEFLKQYFGEHRQEIADNGFSRRVMKNLPGRERKLSQLWAIYCGTITLILFLALNGLEAIGRVLRETFLSMIEYGVANLDIRSLLIAGTVLLFLGVRRMITAE